MRLSELYERVKAGDHITLNDYLMNPPHVYKVMPASMKKLTRKCNVQLSHSFQNKLQDGAESSDIL